VGYKNIIWTRKIPFFSKGMKLGLGIGQGFIADKIKALLISKVWLPEL
jgi:thiamine biosynthesis lipoprotein